MIVLGGKGRTFIGLTDVNMRRLQDGQPIRVEQGKLVAGEVVIFHATRETLLQLAPALGLDELELLDQLGEG